MHTLKGTTMESVTAKKPGGAARPHMGSEYMDAQTYLAQRPRVKSLGVNRKKTNNEPQHGSNDSDFGTADQKQD